MGEIKSAFERAWERAEGLGKLSAEEIQHRKEEEFAPLGRGLAGRYLEHGYAEILIEGLSKYGDEEREIVVKAALSRLVQAIELENGEITTRALKGIIALKGNEELGQVEERIRDVCQGYEQARQQQVEQERERIERDKREVLHQLRISGDAVGGINLKASAAWADIAHELYSRYDKMLRQLRQELVALLLAPGALADEGNPAAGT
jgi:polyhydroxyalkanoate synthesis regulator phasin